MSVRGSPVSSEGENPYTAVDGNNPETAEINECLAAILVCEGSMAVVAKIPRTHRSRRACSTESLAGAVPARLSGAASP